MVFGMVFEMVILLVLGLAAVLLELYFLPGIRTGFPGIFEKIGVYPGLILLPMVLSNSPRYCSGTARDTAEILFLVQTAFHTCRESLEIKIYGTPQVAKSPEKLPKKYRESIKKVPKKYPKSIPVKKVPEKVCPQYKKSISAVSQ